MQFIRLFQFHLRFISIFYCLRKLHRTKFGQKYEPKLVNRFPGFRSLLRHKNIYNYPIYFRKINEENSVSTKQSSPVAHYRFEITNRIIRISCPSPSNDRNPKTDARKPAQIRNSKIFEFQQPEHHCNNFCQRTFCCENQTQISEIVSTWRFDTILKICFS